MTRAQLEHIIRAAAAITDSREIMVVGSQSILGAVPDAPAELRQSMEADIYPVHAPALADLIDGAIGEGSLFQERYGYYAQGVGPETATLPVGWENRVVRVQNPNTDDKVGYCLEPHDLAASKLAAGREKDKAFASALLRHGIIAEATLDERLSTLPVLPERKEHLRLWVRGECERQRTEGGRRTR
jgi:hypothetical protein